MIGEAFINIGMFILESLPIVQLASGFLTSLDFLKNVIGFVNIFLPLGSLLPIIALIITIRNVNIVMSIFNWVVRFIPFIG